MATASALARSPASLSGGILKLAAAALVMTVSLAIGSAMATRFVSVPDTGTGDASLLARLLLVCLLNSAVLVYVLTHSVGRPWQLVGLLFLEHFGVGALMSQSETLYFDAALDVPLGVVGSYLAASLFSAATFAPFAVWLFGHTGGGGSRPQTLGVTRSHPLRKAGAIACVVYPLLYLVFGYFVLWQLPEARQLYQGSTRLVPFAEHIAGVLASDPWLLPWQCLRGALWVTLAIPVLRMSRVGWVETGVILGLLFALLMNTQLLIPNPYLPPSVRLAHFVETSLSNFLLGFATVWILRP